MKNILIYCLLFCLWFFALLAFSAEYPYEKCNWTNKEFTDRLVRESQDFSSPQTQAKAVCIDCLKHLNVSDFLTSVKYKYFKDKRQNKTDSITQVNNFMDVIAKANDIPELCFLAATLRDSDDDINSSSYNFHYCLSANSDHRELIMVFDERKLDDDPPASISGLEKRFERWIYPRRPCLNKDYIKMTAKAFNETANCFGFSSKKDKEQLFALMNHESAFLLNKKASAGSNKARCYGQITNNIIKDIHVGIKTNSKVYHDIYEDALKRCPHLKNKTVSLNECQNYTTIGGFKRCFQKKKSIDTFECKTSQDAYSCLFYTMFNIKKNKIDLEEQLSNFFYSTFDQGQVDRFMKLQKFQQIAKDFKHPIRLNEMVTVEGIITKNGKKKKIQYVFEDARRIFHAFGKGNVKYRLEDLKIKKVKLFNKALMPSDEKLKWFFLHAARNESPAVLNHFTDFMWQVKFSIAKDEIFGKNIRKYRWRILSGNSLDFQVFSELFKEYTKLWSNQKMRNKPEIIQFVNNMDNASAVVTDEITSITDSKRLHEKIAKLDKEKGFNADKAKKFVQKVKDVCPNKLF